MVGHGIEIPETIVDISQIDIKSIVYSLLIKPRTYLDSAVLGAKNEVINSELDLQEFIRKTPLSLSRFIAQEIITGDDDELWVCNAKWTP
jgi:D-aspartate ligase